MKYDRLTEKYEETERYIAILESTLKKEERDSAKDEHSQAIQDNQSAIREVTDNEKLNVRNWLFPCIKIIC